METVAISRSDHVAVVRFDRKGRANALSFSMMDELTRAAEDFSTDAEVSVVILTGAPDVFSAGMDLGDPAFDALAEMPLAERRMLAEHGPRLARSWAGLEAVTIAAVEGPCMAGGLALAAMCDFRVVAKGSRLSAPEVRVAHNMGWHSVPRLVRIVGVQAARRILLSGEEWSAERALEVGFADWTSETGKALDEANSRAQHMAGLPNAALRMIKRQIDATAHGADWALSALDKDQQLAVWASEEFTAARKQFRKA